MTTASWRIAGLRNYWGYNTLCFFAPELRYLSGGDLTEFKTMIKRLHDAGIEVLLDVVYNHTAEGDQMGPTLSFRGIDNASYYRLQHDNRRYYINDTGCGNTLNLIHPRVLQMVMDSLRYWVNEMHVDGFRFDLAVTLGREDHGYDRWGGFFDAIRQDPALSRVKVIAEPWDIGPGGYQLGGFPAGTAEWNDRFRDTVRASGAAMTGCSRDWRPICWPPATCLNTTSGDRGRRSTTSPVTTVSPWPTWSATTTATTRSMAKITATAIPPISVITTGSRADR